VSTQPEQPKTCSSRGLVAHLKVAVQALRHCAVLASCRTVFARSATLWVSPRPLHVKKAPRRRKTREPKIYSAYCMGPPVLCVSLARHHQAEATPHLIRGGSHQVYDLDVPNAVLRTKHPSIFRAPGTNGRSQLPCLFHRMLYTLSSTRVNSIRVLLCAKATTCRPLIGIHLARSELPLLLLIIFTAKITVLAAVLALTKPKGVY